MTNTPILNVRCMTDDHRAMREELRRAEIDLKDQRERVAALRRRLPENPVTQRYAFTIGSVGSTDIGRDVDLADLFKSREKPLMVYHFMYRPDDEAPCPMCTMWMDGFNGVAAHVAQRADLVVVAKAPLDRLRAWAEGRGWRGLRLASSHGTSFNRDFGMESDDGAQWPGVSVFVKKSDRGVAHVYTGSALLGDGNFRGMDQLNPVWNIFDLTPQGRGEFMPQLAYQ